MGLFYCPGDNEVYIDLGFFDELKRKYKALGDFAQAYVITYDRASYSELVRPVGAS